ncbi:hypothetical protein M0R72_04330 [Candidatus Pacearchaeota archaeon]|jgi:uncharacterized protein (UPF0305 family)|nr:hypothetical protein [Candidatus Pacearchaeota archaeon]
METKYVLGIAMFSMMLLSQVGSVSAFGFGNWFNHGANSDEQESLQTAIENEDYDSWKSVMEGIIERIQSLITEDNFNELVNQSNEAEDMKEEQESLQTAIENEDYDSWKSLMEAKLTEEYFDKLVERNNNQTNESYRNHFDFGFGEMDEEVIQAIENEDYDSWKSLMEAKLTEETFNQLVERTNQMSEANPTDKEKNFDSGNFSAPNMKIEGNRNFREPPKSE